MKHYSLMTLALAPILFTSLVSAQSLPTLNDVATLAKSNQNEIATNTSNLNKYHQESRQTASNVLIYSHKNDDRVKADEKSITNNYNEIQTLKKRPAIDQAQIQANKVDINKTNQAIQMDETLIQENSQQVTSLTQHLHSDEQQIQANTQEIKGLRQDLERMANDINGAYADAAALNGLTDPYNIGSVMVSVGVGHHGNADALAVGMGERFNEHVTAKAGASLNSSTSTMTTYAGVGYEFSL